MGRSYIVGDCEVRPDERRVLVGGQPAVLGARGFDLLMCLIELRERMVSKAELMERVWPGAVVEENNLAVHVSALRKIFGANVVATIPGRGYRFAMEVVESSTTPSRPPAGETMGAPDRAQGAGNAVASALTSADAAATAASTAPSTPTRAEADLSLPEKPSIAVLPFDNMGGAAEQEFFIDGVTEDVITELSRFRSLFVIARNSSFSYKGRSVDVRTIARELGVRYVLEGSIRRAANRIRVTAQLIDALTGAHLWAEKYDRALEDIFAVQEDLTQAIVAAIAPQIESFEFQKARSPRPGNLNAYEMAMRARDMARRADKEAQAGSHDEALALATQAAALDPACGTALGTIAYLRWRQIWADATTSVDDVVEHGLAAARSAINADSADHIAHLWKGMLLLYREQHAAGLADLRRAHELNPNDALTLSLLGQYTAGAGDGKAGIQYVTEALRLSPRDGMRWSFLNSLAWACFAAGEYAQAIDAAQRSAGDAPKFYPSHLCLAVSWIGLGETAKAKAEFRVLNELAPEAAAARLAGRWSYADAGLTERATGYLRVAAGLGEPSASAG